MKDSQQFRTLQQALQVQNQKRYNQYHLERVQQSIEALFHVTGLASSRLERQQVMEEARDSLCPLCNDPNV